ncbi:serine/threonine-protein kinase [Planctomycetota bacterium]|nr:serine/threonine-protein kinase [Planctomycetota bacterium]
MDNVLLLQELARKGTVHTIPLGGKAVVGRDPEACQIVVKDTHVSRKHCELRVDQQGAVEVVDLSLSSSGTYVDGARASDEGPVSVKAGGLIRIGREAAFRVLGVLDPWAPERDAQGTLVVPQRLDGRYVILRTIGKGAMGEVYVAWDEDAKKQVAIKRLKAGGRATPLIIDRFKREAMLQGRLRDYPGIVSAYDLGTLPQSGELYCVMEYVKGDSLHAKVRVGITRVEGVRIMARVARALHYAHEHGIIHRDMKPANVMVSDRGQVRLTDFGIAKALEDDFSGLTQTGDLVGTPTYMAPEQIDDSRTVGPLADVYGLGATLYTVLLRRRPYSGDQVSEVICLVRDGPPKRPRDLDPSLHERLDDLVMRSMEPNPADRPASAMAFALELETWLSEARPKTKVRLTDPSSGSRKPLGDSGG